MSSEIVGGLLNISFTETMIYVLGSPEMEAISEEEEILSGTLAVGDWESRKATGISDLDLETRHEGITW